ncbi:MAG TPA: sigma-54 dependent transcriptional regulator [Candidatus Krumholzibacteria bacterium]|nr:sigma-54 dependent transcriptional regulator [Candidatus Krumholzibacteria bacterium]HPD71634.1 sigma-54 dependent transcriptional regulator [Candidatus Krumholzibacteria bacterium]HRY41433.1 sigma-54 dependent transcriptional regulator [Candidatus Krumholzibacteria bacterium]
MAKKPRILVVDDEHTMRDFLTASMTGRYQIRTAGDGKEALAQLQREPVDLVLSDVRMPGGDGLTLLAAIERELDDPPLVVMMTAFGTIKEAVEATKCGAVDYLTKPFGLDQLEHTLQRAFELRALRNENRSLRTTLKAQREQHGLLGASPAMAELREKIEMIADSRGTVLLQGESGTGKEIAARAIHNAGNRRSGPFIRLNCAAIPETLLEGELFGYERGAFTGAVQARPGKFELADGGTLLLDEISEMPLSMQAKVLRVIQEREFMRLGARESTRCDVRIIATSNRNLKEEIRLGRFREDLFYRLNVIPLRMVALRQRKEDIPLLVAHFVRVFCAESGKPVLTVTESAMRNLLAHDWPGNVRQLQNVIERAVIMCCGAELDANQLDLRDEMNRTEEAAELSADLTIREMEQELILRKLQRTGGNRTQAATELGISVRTLRNKLHLYQAQGLSIPG